LAQVNEAIGDPCLAAYQQVVLQFPEYIQGHRDFFMAMKSQDKKLVLAEGHELPSLAVHFNDAQSVDEFVLNLISLIPDNKKELNDYIDTVRKQLLD
jgi:hypothetical protein